jgi:hypothetical protein
MSAFPPQARTAFAAHYPEVPHKFIHSLEIHPLLELEALASFAEADARVQRAVAGIEPMRTIVEQQLDPARNHRMAVNRVGMMHAADLVCRKPHAKPDHLAGPDGNLDELASAGWARWQARNGKPRYEQCR